MLLWLLSAAALAQETTPAATWTPFAKLQIARDGACAAPLGANGRVLIIGGVDASAAPIAAAEILSAEGISQLTSPSRTARSGHTCTALLDGRVLVAGGSFTGSNGEVYDPASEVWLPITSAGPARSGSTATLLQDGRVLIAGGYAADDSPLPYAEIFDPNSNRFTPSRGQLNQPRRGHAASLLHDGRVFLSGGTGLDGAALRSSEYFDPLTGVIWSGPDLAAPRTGLAAVTLEDGRVLVTSGDTAEALDPQGSRWTPLAARLHASRSAQTSILVPGNGGAIVAGDGSSEYFDASNDSFRILDGIDAVDAALAPLQNGAVVACGPEICSRIAFPAISFGARVYHPQETVRIAGSNLPANAAISFAVDFVRGSSLNSSVSASPQFRILAARATTGRDGAFAETPLLSPLNPDIGSRLRLTATGPDNFKLARQVPLKYVSTLAYALPASTVEGQNTALQVAVAAVNGAPLPSGSVTTTFGALTLVELLNPAATVSYSSSRLPSGALSVTSVYPGDAYYDFAVNRTSLGVASRTPVIDVVSSAVSPQIGVPFTVFAQVRVDANSGVAGGPAIAGAVTIYESGLPIGRARVLSSSTTPYPQILTSVEYTTLRLGPDLRFSASFEGDANYRAASSGTLVAPIQRAFTGVSLAAVPSIFNLKPAPGVPVRFHCDVPTAFNVGLAYPPPLAVDNRAFTISATSFTGSTTTLGEGSFDFNKAGAGTAQAVVTIPNDTLRVTAGYAGDGALRESVSAWVPVQLIPVPVSVAFADLPAKLTAPFLTLTASVRNDAGRGCRVAEPTGDVEFFGGQESLGRFALRGNGATLTIPRPFEQGTQDYFIRYYGDPLHAPTDSAIVSVKFE